MASAAVVAPRVAPRPPLDPAAVPRRARFARGVARRGGGANPPRRRGGGALLLFSAPRATPREEEAAAAARERYPDDPNVPPEITALLREVGEGEADVWKSKPAWCQPWTIVLTGCLVILAPDALFQWKWASALVAVPIVAWWYVFLLAMPRQYAEYVESARAYYDRR